MYLRNKILKINNENLPQYPFIIIDIFRLKLTFILVII